MRKLFFIVFLFSVPVYAQDKSQIDMTKLIAGQQSVNQQQQQELVRLYNGLLMLQEKLDFYLAEMGKHAATKAAISQIDTAWKIKLDTITQQQAAIAKLQAETQAKDALLKKHEEEIKALKAAIETKGKTNEEK